METNSDIQNEEVESLGIFDTVSETSNADIQQSPKSQAVQANNDRLMETNSHLQSEYKQSLNHFDLRAGMKDKCNTNIQ